MTKTKLTTLNISSTLLFTYLLESTNLNRLQVATDPKPIILTEYYNSLSKSVLPLPLNTSLNKIVTSFQRKFDRPFTPKKKDKTKLDFDPLSSLVLDVYSNLLKHTKIKSLAEQARTKNDLRALLLIDQLVDGKETYEDILSQDKSLEERCFDILNVFRLLDLKKKMVNEYNKYNDQFEKLKKQQFNSNTAEEMLIIKNEILGLTRKYKILGENNKVSRFYKKYSSLSTSSARKYEGFVEEGFKNLEERVDPEPSSKLLEKQVSKLEIEIQWLLEIEKIALMLGRQFKYNKLVNKLKNDYDTYLTLENKFSIFKIFKESFSNLLKKFKNSEYFEELLLSDYQKVSTDYNNQKREMIKIRHFKDVNQTLKTFNKQKQEIIDYLSEEFEEINNLLKEETLQDTLEERIDYLKDRLGLFPYFKKLTSVLSKPYEYESQEQKLKKEFDVYSNVHKKFEKLRALAKEFRKIEPYFDTVDDNTLKTLILKYETVKNNYLNIRDNIPKTIQFSDVSDVIEYTHRWIIYLDNRLRRFDISFIQDTIRKTSGYLESKAYLKRRWIFKRPDLKELSEYKKKVEHSLECCELLEKYKMDGQLIYESKPIKHLLSDILEKIEGVK